MTTLERLDQLAHGAESTAMVKNFWKIRGIKSDDTRKATVRMADGTERQFCAVARYCYSAWDGCWSNFRLADYAGAVFPGAVAVWYDAA